MLQNYVSLGYYFLNICCRYCISEYRLCLSGWKPVYLRLKHYFLSTRPHAKYLTSFPSIPCFLLLAKLLCFQQWTQYTVPNNFANERLGIGLPQWTLQSGWRALKRKYTWTICWLLKTLKFTISFNSSWINSDRNSIAHAQVIIKCYESG